MPIRERLRFAGIAMFNPRRAAAEGLYDGRILSTAWLNVIIMGWFVISVLSRRETIDLIRGNPMVAASFIAAPFFYAIYGNLIAPRILFRCLITKQKAISSFRQIILFLTLFYFAIYIPYTILCSITIMPNWSSNMWEVIITVICGYWMYMLMYPTYFTEGKKAVKKVFIFGGLSFLFAALLILISAVIVVIAESLLM